jgi:hypothetical protein
LGISHVKPNIKTPHILIGLAGCCLWSGCAHHQAEATSKTAKHDGAATVGQAAALNVVTTTNGPPLSYQWYFNAPNTNGASNP